MVDAREWEHRKEEPERGLVGAGDETATEAEADGLGGGDDDIAVVELVSCVLLSKARSKHHTSTSIHPTKHIHKNHYISIKSLFL